VDYARYYGRTLAQYLIINRRSPHRWRLLLRALKDGLLGEAR
jgi:hypothetical protein